MSTTAVKLGSLAIRTLAKPIANKIKQQAREHPRFRRICVNTAQFVHRIDMRLRLGLLQDPAVAERAAAKRAEEAAKKKLKENEAIYPATTATVSSSAPLPPPPGLTAASPSAKEAVAHPKPRIRPLSESKAIESGANFISEGLLFSVATALILYESVRSRRKEADRRDVVAERLELLESRTNQDEERLRQLEELDHQNEEHIHKLEEEIWKLKGGKGEYPHQAKKRVREVVEPIQLWQAPKDERSIWSRIWSSAVDTKGSKGEEGKEENEVIVKVPAKKDGASAATNQISPGEAPSAAATSTK